MNQFESTEKPKSTSQLDQDDSQATAQNKRLEADVASMFLQDNSGADPLGKLALSPRDALVKAASHVSDADLRRIALGVENTSPENRINAAMVFSGAATVNGSSDNINRLAVAQLNNEAVAKSIVDTRIKELRSDSSDFLGDAASIPTTVATTWLAKSALNSAIPTAIRVPVSIAAGLAVGGMANNLLAGRDAVDTSGYLRNTAATAMIYAAGFVAAGFKPSPSASIWKTAEITARDLGLGSTIFPLAFAATQFNYANNLRNDWSEALAKSAQLKKHWSRR